MARGAKITRKTQLAKREDVKKQLRSTFTAVSAGFAAQVDRADHSLDWWDIYLCKLNTKQFYSGQSRVFVPLVHNAIEARKTRFLNQIFPQAGRYIEVTTEDGEIPHATMALLELYVKRAKLRTKVLPALLVAGDVEGQYTTCVTWGSISRMAVSRETRPIKIGGIEHPDEGEETYPKEKRIEDEGPEVDIVADADLLVLPQTSETIEAALEAGGSVTTLCRWTEARVEELIDAGEIDSDLSAKVLVEFTSSDSGTLRDPSKHLADAAGIKSARGGKFLLVYRTWTKIKIGDERRLVLAYYGGDDQILGCKLCPYWCDKPDIISTPVKKLPGVAKGMSLVEPCADMQYLANDFTNMGADSGIYTVNPVILTDPAKNPRIDSMVLDTMAVWPTAPGDTQPLAFPAVYQHAFNVVQVAERYINATLGVNAAMLPQSTGVPGRKRNQAEIAMEQQIDLLSTNVEVTNIEDGILTPLVERFAEYDAQFRDAEIMVRSVGELGVKAEMQTVPPIQMGKRWQFRWFGVEAARTAQQIQQQISLLNVLKQMSADPAVAQAGYRLNPVPLIRVVTENAFGPRLAPEIFVNQRDKLTLDPDLENSMLAENFMVPVSPMDDDPKHIQSHTQAARETVDFAAQHQFMQHIQLHQQQMQAKQAAQMMQKIAQMMQQGGGAGAPGRGAGAGPQPGGQVTMPRQGRQPAGALHPDQMAKAGGLVSLPRGRM